MSKILEGCHNCSIGFVTSTDSFVPFPSLWISVPLFYPDRFVSWGLDVGVSLGVLFLLFNDIKYLSRASFLWPLRIVIFTVSVRIGSYT